MAQITDNTNGSKIGRCLVYYRNGDGPWQGGLTPVSLTTIREALALNEVKGSYKFDQYRLEPAQIREADWKARDEELEAKLRAERRERGGANA